MDTPGFAPTSMLPDTGKRHGEQALPPWQRRLEKPVTVVRHDNTLHHLVF